MVILEPLCDADSSALARYVLALLKKDKPEKELKRLMIEQLDVFLAEETKPFVERLFEAINNEEYLKTPLPTANNPNILSSIDFEDAEETSTANNAASDIVTIATIGAVAATITNDGVNANIAMSSSSSLMTTGSTVTNVINQNDNAETINNMTAKVIDNNTAISSTHADKVNTPPIDDSKTKDTTTERTSSSISHPQSSSSHHHHQQQQQQHVAGHHHHHNASSNRNETNLYVAGNSSSNNDRNHPRSASPPAARANAADKENQPRESRRRRASLRSRSRSPRSRSRSNERFSRRSRSPRDRRVNEREKVQRQFRNKSPPMGGGGGDSRHDRRRGGGGGGGDRRRMMMNNMGGASSGDRSPRFGGGDRRGSGGGGGGVGGVSGNRSTNRSPISPRSRSPSLERGGRSGKGSPSAGRSQNRGNGSGVGANTSPETRHHHHDGEKRQRCRDFDEKGYCVRGETCPWDHGVNPVVFEGINNTALISMSLREYNPDAPDLWTRSAPPPGALVAGATSGALMAGAAAAAAGINPFTGAVRPGPGMMGGPPGAIGFPQVPGTDKTTNGAGPLAAAEYARNAAAAAAAGAGFRAAAPMMPFPFNPASVTPLQRELIPIPVVDASGGSASAGGDVTAAMQAHSKRRFELEDSVAIADGPTKRKIPAHSRLGPRVPSLQNSSLELRKVPRGLNTIAHLNNHFAKFGKIVNIQISYDGDPEAAIVTFSTHAEANVAYRSTEAVLNNRFIKVFWHTADSSGGGDGNNSMTQQGGRKNSQYHINNVPAVPTPTADSAKTANTSQSQTAGANAASNSSGVTTSTQDTSTTSTANSGSSTTTVAASHVPQPSLRLKNNIPPRNTGAVVNSAVFRKKQEEQVKAVAQLANGLRKRKQELLQSYVKQMKSALDLVERCEPTDPQRGKTLDTIKVLHETIDKLRKEIAAEQEQIQAQIHNQNQPPPVKKSKEQQKKELLDIELELFAQQQEGNDTTAIQKRLEELQRSIGIISGSGGAMSGGGGSPMGGKPGGHYMSGGRPMGRGRASYPEGSTRVDRRPKTIVVTGFSSEDADFVLGHFKHFGEITKHDMDLEKPQLILSYATRINAEQAVLRGKLFKDKRLQMAWAPVVQTPSVVPTTAGNKANTPNVDSKITVADANKNQTQEPTTAISSPNPSQTNSETDANNTDTLPELRLEDEEEDEESEDRSWRR